MKPLRECPTCGKFVSVNKDGRLRAHDERGESVATPRGMRSWCTGSQTWPDEPPTPPTPRRVSIGQPIYYHQTDKGWAYSLLIPTGMDPTHLLLTHDQGQAFVDVARHARWSSETLSAENMRALREALARLERELGRRP